LPLSATTLDAEGRKPQVPPLRYAPVGGCDFFDFFQVLRPESSGEHRPTTILGVLRLRARNPLLSDRSARRFAQDDGLVGVLKNLLVGCVKTTKIKKSQTLLMNKK
jgi:hypothetical protein